MHYLFFFSYLMPLPILWEVNVESKGPYAPEALIPTVIRVLWQHITALHKAVEKFMSNGAEDKDGEGDEVGDGDGDVLMTES